MGLLSVNFDHTVMMRSDLSTFLPTLGLLVAVLKKIRLRTHKKHQKTQKIYSKDRWHCKTMMKMVWLKQGLIQENDFTLLQTRVNSMTVPSDLGRIPHKILSSFGSFTAEQWKNWGKSTVTPNMHLHGHLVDCIKDYGSVYGFWLFFNGTLGNFHNNKKDITAQLMRQFILESQCYQLVTPIMFKEELQPLLPVQKSVSEYHSSSSDFKFVGLPTLSKFSSLDPSDYSLLAAMYSHLYNCTINSRDQMTYTIKKFKTLTLYGRQFDHCGHCH